MPFIAGFRSMRGPAIRICAYLVDLREQRKRNNYAMKKRRKHISPEKARKEAAKVDYEN